MKNHQSLDSCHCGSKKHQTWCLWMIFLLVMMINAFETVNAFVTNGNVKTTFRVKQQGIALYSSSSRTRLYSEPEQEQRRVEFTIRESRYSDLGAVSNIILDSFYPSSNKRSPFRHLFRMSELNRLQQNFPYGDNRHSMLVAIVKDGNSSMEEIVVGFCDVDARPSKLKDSPPRPYLSDLAVHSDWRKCGIAKDLIRKCEDIVMQTFGANDLFIRVEQKNDIAIQMYSGLEYQAKSHPVFGVKDTTILLHKQLSVQDDDDATVPVDSGNNTSTAHVLDYVV